MHWTNQLKFDFTLGLLKLGIYPFRNIELANSELDAEKATALIAAVCDNTRINTWIQHIDLSGNPIRTEFAVKGLKGLLSLNIANCNILVLRLRNLPNLQVLTAHHNRLSDFKAFAVPSLKDIDLSYNMLKKGSFNVFRFLEALNLFCNNLIELDIAKLEKLRGADLRNNRHLRELFISGSPLDTLQLDENLPLNVISTVEVAKRRALDATRTDNHNADQLVQRVEHLQQQVTSPQVQEYIARFVGRFKTTLLLDIFFDAARKYAYILKAYPGLPEAVIAENVVEYFLRSDISSHMVTFLNDLGDATLNNTEINEERQKELNEYQQNIIKPYIDKICALAKLKLQQSAEVAKIIKKLSIGQPKDFLWSFQSCVGMNRKPAIMDSTPVILPSANLKSSCP